MPEKVVSIITGASSGIGRAIARKLADLNSVVALFGRNEKNLESLSEELAEINCESIFFKGDVADPLFVNESVNQIILRFGRVNNLINNAGIAVFKSFEEVSLDEFRRQIDTNLYGVFNFAKAVLPQMKIQKRGTIINISSLSGKHGLVNGTTYAASKHAVMGFSRSLMLELRKSNIRVVSVCPGSVNTGMLRDTPLAPGEIESILEPSDVAETVAGILALPDRALVSEIEIRPTNPR